MGCIKKACGSPYPASGARRISGHNADQTVERHLTLDAPPPGETAHWTGRMLAKGRVSICVRFNAF